MKTLQARGATDTAAPVCFLQQPLLLPIGEHFIHKALNLEYSAGRVVRCHGCQTLSRQGRHTLGPTARVPQ